MNGQVKETHRARYREGTMFSAFSGWATLQEPPGIQPDKALLNLNPILSGGGAPPPIISLAYKMLSSLQSSLGHLEPCVDVRYVISYCVLVPYPVKPGSVSKFFLQHSTRALMLESSNL